jgi:hypothetical protein
VANLLLECERITAAIFSAESRCVPTIMSFTELEDCDLDEAANARWQEIAFHVSALPESILIILVELTDEALLHMIEPPYDDLPVVSYAEASQQ